MLKLTQSMLRAGDEGGAETKLDAWLERYPQDSAARLLRAISRWRRYDAGRQAHMRAALEAVVASKVSKDVYEIAAKSLEMDR